jgi:multidrug efflux pump subunit AcrA (membrane-fusion protein)
MLLQDAPVSREQLRRDIQQSVREAQAAAEKAAKAAVDQANAAQQERVIVGPQGIPVINVPPRFPDQRIPPEAKEISIAFFIVIGAVIIGLPIMRAIARRIERGSPPPAQIPNEVKQQLQQITASVEAIAIEVERISEGQRFTTKMLAERSREGTV